MDSDDLAVSLSMARFLSEIVVSPETKTDLRQNYRRWFRLRPKVVAARETAVRNKWKQVEPMYPLGYFLS